MQIKQKMYVFYRNLNVYSIKNEQVKSFHTKGNVIKKNNSEAYSLGYVHKYAVFTSDRSQRNPRNLKNIKCTQCTQKCTH